MDAENRTVEIDSTAFNRTPQHELREHLVAGESCPNRLHRRSGFERHLRMMILHNPKKTLR